MRRRTMAGIAAGVAAIALVAGVSIAWPGLDAQSTPEVDTAVWALQTGDGQRYARVNTTVQELDTVRGVSNPSAVVQSPSGAFLYTGSNSKLTRIDEALPVDLTDEELQASPSTPAGTDQVATAGDFAAYRTDTGAVWAGRLSSSSTAQLDPFADEDDEDAPQYTAEAIAVDQRGMLFAFSAADDSVLRYDIAAGEVRGRDAFSEDVTTPLLSAAGDTWVLVDGDSGEVWTRGRDGARTVDVSGAVVVGSADPDASSVFIADETDLIEIPVDGGDPDLAYTASVSGVPVAPLRHDGAVYAAWFPTGDGEGTLWSSEGGRESLDYGGQQIGEAPRPVFVATDEAVILNETRKGWVWSVPDGRLLPSSQNWSLDDRTNPESVPSEEQLTVVLDPKPPIAEPDAFGVRAGRLATLPVLLNDHDPNEDVLSIIPESVAGLDPAFGTVSLTDDNQRLAVRVEAEATGTATFQYAVTDGTAADGLNSTPTTVTLTVSTGDGAPEWCGVEGCLQEWPAPEVALGGTVTVPVLPGWVDPDGDPLLLLSVDNLSGIGTVAATPGGEIVYQHSNDGSVTEQPIELNVNVADTSGQVSSRPLTIQVSPDPVLAVQSFTVLDTLDAGITVDVEPHVTGTAGQLSVSSVRVLGDAAATASVIGGSTSFDFSASEPGVYRVDFTVTDGLSEATGTARITLLPPDAPAQLATSPVVAFVHPQEDATLDVFAAVSNPTRRVLLLSDVAVTADEGATLSVDAVGQNNLRVSGTTASGAAGRLGTVTYTVSDGTEDEGARVSGEATVYLLPPAPEIAPIAVDDNVVVRAGAQIDIPVLDNDISPAGGRPTLNPASVVSSDPSALAFASAGVLRYLAPSEPGDYTVDYSVYTTGAPALADDATVRIRVLPADANRAPVPDRLEGRVLSGSTTTIEFDGFGMDPDGDVVTLDRIVAQPERGVAAIAADGESIVYTSVPGDAGGQVSFRYRVVDAAGERGEGTVRVGILDADANPSPVTFTDYVQVQAGESNTVRVSPLANDVDPTQGSLTITDVRPDLPQTLVDGSPNPEYERLEAQIASVGDTGVVLSAGTTPGTMSFLYDVESDSGNTGRGLIVVKVVRESVPDYPVVADTVLSVENRDDFESGVDVLSGKATWSGGDVADLEVSLWGEPEGVSASGRELSGELPETSRLIPFAVSGTIGEQQITTYAFLRVPGDDDLALALRAGTNAQQVTELESVDFDMASLVALPRGADMEVGSDVRSSGARPDSSCAVTSGTTIRYTSGAGAPWTDACQVPVRLAGTEDWTYLSVPVLVAALNPQPELRPASLTVGPGETATYDLKQMTSWQLGRENWDSIQYSVDYAGAAFTVTQQGSIVTVNGADRAVPGTESAAVIGVPSHTAVNPARLILRVGAAPSTLPQGGSVTQQCSQASGSGCTLTVIGTSSEVNPLPRTPLELVDVRPTGACVGVSFRVASAGAVAASWTPDAPGATCTATFSVRDAQGRITAGERDGRILLDLQGFPKTPAAVRQTGYADGTVTLRVDPGEARLAYPSLSGFVIRSNGAEVARCGADGSCPPIGAPNGEQRVYEAWAVNGVGESRGSVRTTAWAYDAPGKPVASWTPDVTGNGQGGRITIEIDQIDWQETGYLVIASQAGETRQESIGRNQDSITVRGFAIGTNNVSPVTITPYSRFSLPPGLGGSQTGSTETIQANGVGAPLNLTLSLNSTSIGDGQSRIDAVATATPNGSGSEVHFAIVPERDRCEPTGPGGGTASFTVEDGQEYTYEVCAESIFQGESYGRQTVEQSVRARQSEAAPQGWTFRVDPTPRPDGRSAVWLITEQPRSDQNPPRNNTAKFINWNNGTNVIGQDPGIRVYYEHNVFGWRSQEAPVQPASGSAPFQVRATWSLSGCTTGGTLSLGSETSAGQGTVTSDYTGVVYRDAANNAIPLAEGADRRTVPPGATKVEGVKATVTWPAGWNLNPYTDTFGGNCTIVQTENPPPPAGG